MAYWNLDGNANDQTGVFNASATGLTDITFVTGRNAASGQAAQFNGTTSLIEIPNADPLVNTSDFSLSFWIKEDTTAKTHQFVLGIAGFNGFQFEIDNNGNTKLGACKLGATYSLSNGAPTGQDMPFSGAATGTTLNNGGWKGFTFEKDLTSNNGTGLNGLLAEHWAQVVCTYDHATKIGTMYINGEEMHAQDFNLYGTDNALYYATGLAYGGLPANNTLVFGFVQDKVSPTITQPYADYSDPTTGHFKGLLDDVAVYHKLLTPAMITLMYNSGKP
jgi:hypothetical protein